MKWKINEKKWGGRGFISSPLTIKSIRKLTKKEKTKLANQSWGDNAYWVEFQEDIEGKGIYVFKNTFHDVSANSNNKDTDVFYFFVHFLNQKKEVVFRNFFNDRGASGRAFFGLSDISFDNKSGSRDVNEIMAQEKAKWDKLGYTKDEDLVQENKENVDKEISKEELDDSHHCNLLTHQDLQEENNQLKNQVKQLLGQLKELEDLRKKNEELVEINNSINELTKTKKELEKEEEENIDLGRKIIAKEEEKVKTPPSDNRYQELMEEVAKLKGQLEESRKKIFDLQKQTSESKKQLEEQCRLLEEQIKQRKGELSDLKKEYIKKLTDGSFLRDMVKIVGRDNEEQEQKELEKFSAELDDIFKKQTEIAELEAQFKNIQKGARLISLSEEDRLSDPTEIMTASVVPPQLLNENDGKLVEDYGCDPSQINYNKTYPHDSLKEEIKKNNSLPLSKNDLPLKLYSIKNDQDGDPSFKNINIEELTKKHVKTRDELLKIEIKNYATLSYVWGKVENKDELTSSGRKSLTKAIKACQYLGIDYLWIDQLCINQKDRAEKEEEVKKMRKCYGKSAITLVAIQRRLKERIFDSENSELKDLDLLFILKQIYVSEWFSRSWTFQEGFLSKHTVFMFDDYLIDGRYVAQVWALNQPSYVSHAKFNSMKEFINSSVKIATPVGWAYYKDGYKKEEEIKLKLHEALRATKGRERGIPVDAVYSILGLLPYSEQVKVEYKERGRDYVVADVEKALLAVMKVAVEHGEPLSWHGVANSSGGLCWMPEVHYDKAQEKKKNGSMKVQGGINISYKGENITNDLVFSEKGIRLSNCLELTIEKVDSDTTKVENGFLIDGGVHTRDVLVKFDHNNYQKITLLGTKKALDQLGNEAKLIIVDKEVWNSDKDFALLVKKQGNTYHRLGLVEFLMKSEELEKVKNKEKKEIVIGLEKEITDLPQRETLIEVNTHQK